LIEHVDVGDDARKRDLVAVVAIDAVQTRRSTRDVVGLRLDDESEPRLRGTSGRTFALVLGARQDYSFVSKSSCS
jgi:hypothetical protein